MTGPTLSGARPPAVIGYAYKTFYLGMAGHYRCGADSPPADFPLVRDPIYRGEAPEDALCEVCGIRLVEL